MYHEDPTRNNSVYNKDVENTIVIILFDSNHYLTIIAKIINNGGNTEGKTNQ
jgi:hypothetical protein